MNVLGVPELGIIFFEISNVKRFRTPSQRRLWKSL